MRLIATLVLASGLIGCAGRAPMVELQYAVPAATASDVSERYAVPVGQRLRELPDVRHVITISGGQKMDAYVVGAPGSDLTKLLAESADCAAATSKWLPKNATPAVVTAMSGGATIPSASTETVDTIEINIDHQAADDAGVTTDEISRAIASVGSLTTRPATDDGLDCLRSTVIRTVDGKRTYLGDIASVTIRKTPKEIRREF